MGVGPAVSELALAGYDTSALDTLFVNAASIILPAWGAIVGTIFVFGTIAKVAFPDKYDAAVYKNKAVELVQDEIIDLDNLSPRISLRWPRSRRSAPQRRRTEPRHVAEAELTCRRRSATDGGGGGVMRARATRTDPGYHLCNRTIL